MEGDTHLMQVIRDMRSQINKLERENQALREERSSGSSQSELPDPGSELKCPGRRQASCGELSMNRLPRDGIRESKDVGWSPSTAQTEETSPINQMRRTVSASAALGLQEPQRGTGNIMTVRRYSIASTVHSIASSKTKLAKRHSRISPLEGSQPDSSTIIDFVKEDESMAKIPSRASTNSISSTRSLQKYLYKCRGNIKAVKFLLPVEMASYSENQKCPQNQDTKHLSTIIEKDP